jgi:hypothetical protein
MPGSTDRRRKLYEGVIRFSDGTVDEFQQSLVKIARWLDDEVRNLAVGLDLAEGKFVTSSAAIARVTLMRHQIDELLAKSGYTQRVGSFLSEYPALQRHVEHAWNASGLPPGLRAIDADALRAIAGAQFDAFANIGKTGIEQVKRSLFLAVAGGSKFESFGRDLRELLLSDSSLRDAAGKGMFRHAATLARTTISELHATMSNNLAAQAGIDRFEFIGPLVSTSRPFCIAHRGKTYTRAQIAKMDNGQTGRGTVLVARGGFNCNHQWMPVIVEDEIAPPTTPETSQQVAA